MLGANNSLQNAGAEGDTRTLRLKPESLQPIGSFKLRGAANMVAARLEEARRQGIVTHSSGNHGQGVAYAARSHGIKATVVVPDVAPQVKIDAMRALGAELVLVQGGERLSSTQQLVEEHGLLLVPPFDAPEIIAGQGTIGLEIAADWPEVETILVPVGGGGLASGVAVAAKKLLPDAKVIGVEPELAAETRESLRKGVLTPWPTEQTYQTIADGVRTAPSELTFAHLRAYLDDIITVTEDEILAAVNTLAREAHLIAEPSGALTTAAFLFHQSELPPNRHHAAVVSGGNIDTALLARILAA